jgi:hypothetical protein
MCRTSSTMLLPATAACASSRHAGSGPSGSRCTPTTALSVTPWTDPALFWHPRCDSPLPDPHHAHLEIQLIPRIPDIISCGQTAVIQGDSLNVIQGPTIGRGKGMRKPSRVRVLTAFLAMVLPLGALMAFTPSAFAANYTPSHATIEATNAQNIVGCQDSSRKQAAQYASTGRWYDPVPQESWSEIVKYTPLFYNIELRYFPETHCVWAVAGGNLLLEVWIDRSQDGGRSWDGKLGDRTIHIGQFSTYTGVFNDSSPYVARACGTTDSVHFYCTQWFGAS